MDMIHRSCAGLDIAKNLIVACARQLLADDQIRKLIKTFGTTTRDLLALADWLAEQGVTHVAMESTGVYWKPIFNILEDRFEILLVNARHIRNVPGRKTDVKDCEWIAQLLQYGLLSPSFIPERPQRELRDLTRHRVQLVEEKNRACNRIQKVLEDANIKLASVASDVLGVSGRSMIQAIIDGKTNPEELADLARRKLRNKIPELQLALEGRITEHHRFMLKILMEQVGQLERGIAQLEERIEDYLNPQEEAVARLTTIPGVDRRAAANILAEIGSDMSRFPTGAHLASWAGVCPGNNESAGKHKSAKTRKGSRWLRRSLAQAAWAASHAKAMYLQAQFKRLAKKRGKKRAIVAVGHTILKIIYAMLRDKKDYQDLGADYFDRQNPERLTRYHVKRLESLGHCVSLSPAKMPA